MTPAVPDPTVEARIAGVLREHARWEHGTGPDGYPTHRCRCGVDLPHGRADRVAPLHRAHVAAALAPVVAAEVERALEEAAVTAPVPHPVATDPSDGGGGRG